MVSDNRGFTILAAVVGLLLVSITGKALMELTKTSMKSSRAIDRITAHSRLSGNLELVFRDDKSCAGALRVKHLNSGIENAYFHPLVAAGQKAVINKIIFQGTDLAPVGSFLGDSFVKSITLSKKGVGINIPSTLPQQTQYDSELVVTLEGRDGAYAGSSKKLSFLITVRSIADSSTPGRENILSCERKAEVNSGTYQPPSPTPIPNDSAAVCASIVGGYYDTTLSPPRCRVLLEKRTDDPQHPSIGQMWIRTDL